MYSFCLPFLDPTIRNVYFDGRVFGRTHLPFHWALCCTTTPWRREHLEESMGPSWEYINAHRDDSYPPVTRSQHRRTATWHPPFFTFYFRSFNQFVSSALTSSSTRSKVITRHYPPSWSLHTTHTHTLTFTLLKICLTNLMSDHIGEFITVFGFGHPFARNGDH